MLWGDPDRSPTLHKNIVTAQGSLHPMAAENRDAGTAVHDSVLDVYYRYHQVRCMVRFRTAAPNLFSFNWDHLHCSVPNVNLIALPRETGLQGHLPGTTVIRKILEDPSSPPGFADEMFRGDHFYAVLDALLPTLRAANLCPPLASCVLGPDGQLKPIVGWPAGICLDLASGFFHGDAGSRMRATRRSAGEISAGAIS